MNSHLSGTKLYQVAIVILKQTLSSIYISLIFTFIKHKIELQPPDPGQQLRLQVNKID